MKKLAITLITIISLLGANISQGAETYKTLIVNATTTTATYNIPAGELCHVLYVYNTRSQGSPEQLSVTISGTTFGLTYIQAGPNSQNIGVFSWYTSSSSKEPKNLVIAGPATITLIRTSSGGVYDNFCTLRLIPTPNIGGVGQ